MDRSLEGHATLPVSIGLLSRLAAERVIEAGIDLQPLLKRAGLPPTLMDDQSLRVSAHGQIVFLNLAAEILDDALLGFHIAQKFELRRLGLFYYALSSSATLSDAFSCEERYISLLNEALRVQYRKTNALSLDYEYVGIERHLDRHQMEFWITGTIRGCRQFTKLELVPTFIGLVHRHEGDVSEMERYFGCRLEFEADRDRISFDPQVAEQPLVTADPYLHNDLIAVHEEVILRRPRMEEPFRTRVENAITPRLSHGTVNIGTIASDLGLSPRTLSRRLADEGLTFSAILENLRLELADRYLQNRDLSVSQVAWLLGYAEVSSFAHAFQRWTGKTPSQARRDFQHRSKENSA
ncbi:AraC family transcriptional regulator [Microvirga terricola]|uniref:AraC family transcriptional regulator n=1 Tax=Microvirga terricola TaxID=2719797 RepID=A0ABX0VCY8_9HYPH|nr:AraC family transcriptional regulator [Microvirga terricola]NIX75702.1 AraC family transcriptional regulator [Microvirga terricola]